MTIFKCKMCGGSLEIQENQTTAVCEYCGTEQTLPKLADDRRANLYDRANHFRRNNEFDKASAIYEKILNEDGSDAEVYWSLVLCRYGIEYVEDPATHKRVPTVNRAQFTSIFDDENYKSALQYADISQKSIYEQEANVINEIQKGILAISQKEEPFDIFICYKETDNSGRRTQDSVLANDLYHQLTAEGFKVFFSRITLEDKLGVAYEPYIFAALNSAKVMVVIGTKPEYFNAVWVKNEWSRYLALVRQSGGEKILIPAYRDMDPYDLPEEFSHLQAQDMSKLGFMQDLIRGIKKITDFDTPQVTITERVTVSGGTDAAPLLRRAYLFLEDDDFESAEEYFEKVLDIEPENAQAYLGKLMVEMGCCKQEELKDCDEPFDDLNNYQKVIRFGNEKLKTELQGYIDFINNRNEQERLTEIYNSALKQMQSADTDTVYKSAAGKYKVAASKFESIKGFRDADAKEKECLDKAEIARKDAIYDSASVNQNQDTISALKKAIDIFSSIPGWKDADERSRTCEKRIEKLKVEEEHQRIEREREEERQRIEREREEERQRIEQEREAERQRIEQERKAEEARKKRKRTLTIVIPILIICIGFGIVWINQAEKYKIEKMNEKLHPIKSASVGSVVKFGRYEQNNNEVDGKEDIEWLILAKDEKKALMISKYCLDCQDYNYEPQSVTWEDCDLRKWLNRDFFGSAFQGVEKEMICSNDLITDKIFLLDFDEAETYFSDDFERKVTVTVQAEKNADWKTDIEEGYIGWWLRCDTYSNDALMVDANDGHIRREDVSSKNGVRPALWISLE